MSNDQTTLPGAGIVAPTIQKEAPVKVLGGSVTAGFVGKIPERDCLGFVSEKGNDRRYKDLIDDEAHALNTEALDVCHDRGVKRILIVEPDTGDVYEYQLEDFTKWGTLVPDGFLQNPGQESQRYVDRRDPWRLWQDHADDVYRPDVDGREAFERASDQIEELTGGDDTSDDGESDSSDRESGSDDDESHADDVPLEEKPVEELTDEERLELAYRRGEEKRT